MISTRMVQEILHNKISNLMDQIIYHKNEQGQGVAFTTDRLRSCYWRSSHHSRCWPWVKFTRISSLITAQIKRNSWCGIWFSISQSSFLSSNLFFASYEGQIPDFTVKHVLNLNLTDMETYYKVFRIEILKQINIEENPFWNWTRINSKGCETWLPYLWSGDFLLEPHLWRG